MDQTHSGENEERGGSAAATFGNEEGRPSFVEEFREALAAQQGVKNMIVWWRCVSSYTRFCGHDSPAQLRKYPVDCQVAIVKHFWAFAGVYFLLC